MGEAGVFVVSVSPEEHATMSDGAMVATESAIPNLLKIDFTFILLISILKWALCPEYARCRAGFNESGYGCGADVLM